MLECLEEDFLGWFGLVWMFFPGVFVCCVFLLIGGFFGLPFMLNLPSESSCAFCFSLAF